MGRLLAQIADWQVAATIPRYGANGKQRNQWVAEGIREGWAAVGDGPGRYALVAAVVRCEV
jgi:hypothetical protein